MIVRKDGIAALRLSQSIPGSNSRIKIVPIVPKSSKKSRNQIISASAILRPVCRIEVVSPLFLVAMPGAPTSSDARSL